MTRSSPDAVFAAAVRTTLEERVRAHATETPRPERAGLVRESLVASLVVASVATVLLGAQHGRRTGDVPAGPTSSTTAMPPRTTRPSGSSALIGPPAARVRTDEEIREWAARIGASTVWTEQRVLIRHCMADEGFLFDPIERYTADLRAGHSGMSPADEQRWEVALSGHSPIGAYDWRTAGCEGRAVHTTGMDGAH